MIILPSATISPTAGGESWWGFILNVEARNPCSHLLHSAGLYYVVLQVKTFTICSLFYI